MNKQYIVAKIDVNNSSILITEIKSIFQIYIELKIKRKYETIVNF